METQFIRLNMIPSGVIPIFNISQYDVGRMLGVYVYAGIRNVNLDNYTVTVEATRSDGTAIIVGVTTNNNVGTFEVTPVMSNLANSYRAQLVITDGNSKRIASLPFIINVIRAAMNENSEAIEEDASLYQQYTEAMQGTIAEVKAEINSEKSSRIQSDATLNTRIDNIIAPSGEAPSAAEVTDARIGANGTTYASLGTAIRTQISNLNIALNNNVDDVKLTNANIDGLSKAVIEETFIGEPLSYSNDTQGSWMFIDNEWKHITTGTDAYYHTVDYAVTPGKTYLVCGSENTKRPIATFWDSNANMIGTSGDYAENQTRSDRNWICITIPKDVSIMRVLRFGLSSYPTVYEANLQNNLENQVSYMENEIGFISRAVDVDYPFQSGDGVFNTVARCFWGEIIPANAVIKEVKVHIGNKGTDAGGVMVDIWEKAADVLTKVKTVKHIFTGFNTDIIIPIGHISDKPRMISYTAYTGTFVVQYYRANQPGYSWKYTTDRSEETTTLSYSGLSNYSNMKLIGGFTYAEPIIENERINVDLFSGIHDGNMVVFGDSTVDGTSTTDHTSNVIGTDRTAATDPYVYTSILENMLNTFIGGSKRVYNAGFGGKTLNYIADNYDSIMAAFSNVKSALLVLDVNSASGTRLEYEERIRTGLERMISFLRADGIAIAVVSPQPMFYYPADGNGLPAINSAGEYYIAVNIGKDVCQKYGIPFIDLAEKTNYIMESPYLSSDYFFGDRIHFGDNGHKIEGYELYGELIHPIVYFDGLTEYIGIPSNKGELSNNASVLASFVGGYQSIVLQATNTRTDVLHRVYVISKVPFTIEGIDVTGWTSYYDIFVDGSAYTSNTVEKGATIQAGAHEITIKPTGTGHVVRYSGIILRNAE